MLVRRVLFPDTVPWVRGRVVESLEGEDVDAYVATRLPDFSAVVGDVVVQIRNDSGPTSDMLKTERYGVNVYARSRGAGDRWQRDDAKASMIARHLSADLVGSANSGPVVAVEGGAGPYEVAEEEDALDAFSHYYFTVALTVRGSSR